MMINDEISKNAIVLTANEPKLRENNGIATQISALLYPMREIDEISIMAKDLPILLTMYEAFLEISQIY